ncbi:uncharacterized protein lrrc41 [Vanacampus margaritifer]
MERKITTLRDVCLQKVHFHFSVKDLGKAAVLNLPSDLLKDLLPYMDPVQLDQLQPDLEVKGISTFSAWMKMYQELAADRKQVAGRKQQRTFDTSQEVKVEVMRRLFAQCLRDSSINLDSWFYMSLSQFLSTAVKYVNHVALSSDTEPDVDLKAGDPLLASLEKTVESLTLKWTGSNTSRELAGLLSFLVHRFLDHGVVKHVSLYSPYSNFFSWLFTERGHLYRPAMDRNNIDNLTSSFAIYGESLDQYCDENGPNVKRCRMANNELFSWHRCIDSYPGCVTPCPGLKIQSLVVTECIWEHVKDIIKILPTFDSLTNLTLQTQFGYSLPIWVIEDMAEALVSLSSRPRRSLRRVSIRTLQCGDVLCDLLQAYRELKELDVGVTRVITQDSRNKQKELEGEFQLEQLSITLDMTTQDADFLLTTLRACPHLLSLHVSGMRLPTGHSQKELLNTLAESNVDLASLNLYNLNLSDCMEEIIKMLSVCKLEELHLADCRLLEFAADKAASLRQLVDALKTLPSLRKLNLSHNRLAKHVHELAQLFSGPACSSLEYLHVGANFIQPADLLVFAETLSSHPPPRRLTLDLATNPGDRDADTWKAALDKLRPFCHLLTNEWDSRNVMADFISVM